MSLKKKIVFSFFVSLEDTQVVKMLDGNKTKAAEVLGISRTSLWKILKEE